MQVHPSVTICAVLCELKEIKETTVIFVRRRGEGYLGSQAAQHHVSEQFGSKHGESGAQHRRYNGECKACQKHFKKETKHISSHEQST